MKKILLPILFVMCCLIATAQPVNDEPCGAILIPISLADTCVPSTSYSWIGATTSLTNPAPGCQWTTSKKDVWFKFTAPATGNITISTDVGNVGTDFTMALYSATTCSSGFAYLSCDDDSGPGAMPTISQSGLTPGQIYYIKFWGYNASQADADVKICIFSEPLTGSKIGVGTSTPTTTLDINGTIRIRGGSPASSKVLTSDGNGNASWQYPSPEAFISMIPLSGSNTVLVASGTKLVVPFQTDVQPANTVVNSNFNNTTHIYSAAEAGVYHFEIGVVSYFSADLVISNGNFTVVLETSPVGNSSFFYRPVSITKYLKAGEYIPSEFLFGTNVKLAAGEQVRVTVFQNVQPQYGVNTNYSKFSGTRIY